MSTDSLHDLYEKVAEIREVISQASQKLAELQTAVREAAESIKS